MNLPPITDAKRIAIDNRAIGALVVTFGDGQYATASYGLTRPLCDAMRSVNEQIAELIKNGTLKIPDALRGGR